MYPGWPIQPHKPLSEFPLDAVAELPCLVQQGRAGAVLDRYRRRHGVEKKSDDVTVEEARDDLDHGKAHVIGRRAVKAKPCLDSPSEASGQRPKKKPQAAATSSEYC
jgi:hypothetical protein